MPVLNETLQQMEAGSYRGVPFLVSGTQRVAGGRKTAKFEFVNSDRQTIEDLGLRNRVFTVKAIVTPQFDAQGNTTQNYFENRDALLSALEKPGPGTLIHPWYGKLENIAARTYELEESLNDLGKGTVTIKFEFSNSTGQPVTSFNTPALISQDQQIIANTAAEDIADNFRGDLGGAGGTGPDAVAKVQEFADKVGDVAKAVVNVSPLNNEDFNALYKSLGKLSSNASTLITTPSVLARDLNTVMAGLVAIFTNPIDNFNAMVSMFEYGALDIPYLGTPTGLTQIRQKNRDLMNFNMRALALSYAYVSASEKTYDTVADIETDQKILEDQYRSLGGSNISKELLDTLTDQRGNVAELFGQQKLTARREIDIRTNLTTSRLLAYRYYGSSEDGETLAKLNGLPTLVMQGDVKILTP